MVIHYELFFFYIAGFKPKDIIKLYGYSRSTAYRFYRIFRLARKRAQATIEGKKSVPPKKEKFSVKQGGLLDKNDVL